MKPGRHKAREEALQILFQLDMNNQLKPELGIEFFRNHFRDAQEPFNPFTEKLVLGVVEKAAELDAIVQKSSENWKASRMTIVDRNVLRLGVYEMHHCDDIPATVTINEMVELAKRYGTEESSGFVNGLLDRIKGELNISSKAP